MATEAEWLSMIVLGSGSFTFGMLPIKLQNRARKNPLSLSLLLCAGGGVLLATSLVHMLSEAREDIPFYAELYFSIGFLILYSIDEVVHFFIGDENNEEAVSQTAVNENSPIYTRRESYGTKTDTVVEEKAAVCMTCIQPSTSQDYVPIQSEDECCKKHIIQTSHRRKKPKKKKGNLEENETKLKNKNVKEEICRDKEANVETGVHCHLEVGEPCNKNTTTATGLLLALLVHSLLEGMAIGIQPNSAKIILVLAAVSCHKFVVSFCLGVELAVTGFRAFRFVTAMALFSVGAPLGILVGMFIKDSDDVILNQAAPYIQAVAGGSLLYVTTCEVLPREKTKWQHNHKYRFAGLLQFLSVIFGFSWISWLNIYLVDEHGHASLPLNDSALSGA